MNTLGLVKKGIWRIDFRQHYIGLKIPLFHIYFCSGNDTIFSSYALQEPAYRFARRMIWSLIYASLVAMREAGT